MASRCYNNEAFIVRSGNYDVRDTLNSRLELGAFHAYNESFVDDDNAYLDDEYVDIVDDRTRRVRRGEPKCRRSIAAMPVRYGDGRSAVVGFHRDRYGSLGPSRHRYESVSSIDDGPARSTMRPPTTRAKPVSRDCYDAVHRRYEEIEVILPM